MARYFEDFAIGDSFDTASATIGADDLLAFARTFDPQPFHLDAAAAANGPFGELVTSGWHTAAVTMRLLVESRVLDATGIVGLGIDELRWLAPVRPGDTLRARMEVASKTPSSSGKRRGVMRVRITVRNQRDEPVLSEIAILTVAGRPIA
ncbi:MAG TPA: MaoC family dehydratase [Candidatus Baltobacteraceae bacterium]|jgi:acyl dehydratase